MSGRNQENHGALTGVIGNTLDAYGKTTSTGPQNRPGRLLSQVAPGWSTFSQFPPDSWVNSQVGALLAPDVASTAVC